MMNMYQSVCGSNSISTILLQLLNLNIDDIDRFRDCYLANNCIVIYTRTGGGNRSTYAKNIQALRAHPLYVSDQDDDFDNTYANFFFTYPPDSATELTKLAELQLIQTPDEKWSELFAHLKNG